MKVKILIVLGVLLIASSLNGYAQDSIDIRYEDKIRIKEAMEIAEKFGDSVWPGFSETPFTIILVSDKYEFLINHPYPSDDFKLLRHDETLQSAVYYRKQQFNKHFLATFPAVNGVNCVVIGTPENTNRTSTQWIITLLHEHFHQYQYNSPNYHEHALDLGLSNGDTTGMWQINYTFPYSSKKVNAKYNSYTKQLAKTVKYINHKSFRRHYKKLHKARGRLEKTLSKNDYKYLLFQWYQEGVARYTEYAFLERLSSAYVPSKEIEQLSDFVAYDIYKKQFYKKHIANVSAWTLKGKQRETVYDVGFAQSLILRKQNPEWTANYLTQKFDLRRLYDLKTANL